MPNAPEFRREPALGQSAVLARVVRAAIHRPRLSLAIWVALLAVAAPGLARLDIDSSLAGVMQGMLVLFVLLVGGWQVRRARMAGD